ncbi:MAG TPA: hypothetical protein VKQ30_02800 [Ktedonobacterales bacterium]|nr:hypothetical protein [Ktedonobacterales bacterium]
MTVTCLHRGVVRTHFGAEDQARFFAVISRVVLPPLKTPAEGAQTPFYLASSPDVEGVTGQFFASRKPTAAPKAAYDSALTARLWQVSADLVSLTQSQVQNERIAEN